MKLGEDKVLPTAEYLSESGLLFEINRLVLNPIGLHLGLDVAEDGSVDFAELIDASDDAEGIVLSNRDVLRGAGIFANSEKIFELRRQRRKAALGYVIQPVPGVTPEAIKPVQEEAPAEAAVVSTGSSTTSGAAEAVARESNVVKSQQSEPPKVSRESALKSKYRISPSAKAGDCPHPDDNISRESISGGGSVVFCSLCGTQFKDSDLVQ